MKKSRPISAFQGALMAMSINYVPVDGGITETLIESTTPEDLFIRKERSLRLSRAYQDLSDEAKQVIDIVCQCAREPGIALFAPSGSVLVGASVLLKKAIRRRLKRDWKDSKYINDVFQEIENFVRAF